MSSENRPLPQRAVLDRMRAPYPAALQINRYEHRSWAIDVVTYDREQWAAFIFGATLDDGKRLGPFISITGALAAAKYHIEELIVSVSKEPPEPPAKKPKRKKARATA